MRSAILGYYTSKIGSDISVNLTMYDSANVITTNTTNATKHVYHIVLGKLISGTSVANIFAATKTSSASHAIELPNVVQLSATPLSGKYRVKCINAQGYTSYSEEISTSTHGSWVHLPIMRNCTGLYDKIQAVDAGEHAYSANGRSFFLRFQGINEDPGQFSIESSTTEPLTGENLTISQNTTIPYSSNLFYEPIPFEMLKTYETEPQVIVTVDGLPAVCHNLTCNFTYIAAVGEVTAFTFTESTRRLSLTGTSFPTNSSDIRSIEFAKSECVLDTSTLTSTSLQCTLATDPTCGTHLPILTSILGVVPNSASLASSSIACSVSGLTPTGSINLLGGDNLTISGTNFPTDLSRSTVSITFSDTAATQCAPQTSTSTALVCLTSAFDATASAGQSLSLAMTINGLSVTNSLSTTLMDATKAATLMTPSSVSPVLKTMVNITLASAFPYTLSKQDFTVNATNTTNTAYVRYLNVIEVNDATKTLTCMFGGAWTGQYSMSIRHAVFGLIDTSALELTVGSNVTTVSPTSGSIYGGTLVTITGTNFGT